jgi:DNA-binding transcriptional ArsR family regulator
MKKPRQMRVFPAVPRAATGMAAVKRNAKRTVSLAGFGQMAARAKQASAFLKALSHESRLLILCLLCEGEKSVTELEDLLSLRQSAVSQQLARLRLDGLVRPRRNGKAVHYSLANDGVGLILGTLHALFCKRAKRYPAGTSRERMVNLAIGTIARRNNILRAFPFRPVAASPRFPAYG